MRSVFGGEEPEEYSSGDALGGPDERPPSLWDDEADTSAPPARNVAASRSPGSNSTRRRRIVAVAAGAAVLVSGAVWWGAVGGDEPVSTIADVEERPTDPAPPRVPAPTAADEIDAEATPSSAPAPSPTAPQAATQESPNSPPRLESAPPQAVLPAALAPSWDPFAALEHLPDERELSHRGDHPYDRDAFGQQWMDVDRNGCDTRNDILRRDLMDLRVKPGTNGCVAHSGRLIDPYTARSFAFERGSGNAGELHIDHVVALGDAWRKGAWAWSPDRREAFANDPLNLVVTFGDVNMEKGAKDASEWLPPDKKMHCGFALQVIYVKQTYDLAVSDEERAALFNALGMCTENSPLLGGWDTGL
jgi:hypothetical protein